MLLLAEHVPAKSVPEMTFPVSVHVLEPVASRSPRMRFPVTAKFDELVMLRSKVPLPVKVFPLMVASRPARGVMNIPPVSMTFPVIAVSPLAEAMP